MDSYLSKKQSQLQNHAANKIKQFNSQDLEKVRPQSSQVKSVKQGFVQVKVPPILQGIASDISPAPQSVRQLPYTLVTTRLHPTADLPEVYRNGLVEGNNACWRDVQLRGHIPGPIVRQNSSAHASRTSNAGPLSDAGDIEPYATLEIDSNVDVRPPVLCEPGQYENVGILMRNEVYEVAKQSVTLDVPLSYYPDKASVKAAVSALQRFDSANPYVIDTEMRRVIKQLQRDIYGLRELCQEDRDALSSEAGRTLSDRIEACRQILLMDMNDGFLQLEDFDAADAYEIHTPREWIDLHSRQFVFPDGREMIGVPAFSRYLYKDRVALEPVVVTAYNEDDAVWHIYWVPQNTYYFAIEGQRCLAARCALMCQLNGTDSGNGAEAGFKVYSNAPAFVSPAEKAVKRLNLLFADEDERMWWERRWYAHYTRRLMEAQTKQDLFLQMQFERACRIREHLADSSKVLDFKVTRLLEVLSDVSGPTSEIIDNIFHTYVLDNDGFYKSFISRIDERSYERMLMISYRLVADVTENLLQSNMLAVIEYLRRDHAFDLRLYQIGLCPARFARVPKFSREISTVSAEFYPDAIESLMNFAKRRARINIISLYFSCYYKNAYEHASLSIYRLLMTPGVLFFNFAGIIPFIAQDQIQLIVQGFCGGITADQESFSVSLALTEHQEAKPVDEVVKKGGLRIRIYHEQTPATKYEDTTEITTIPFYAHPQAKNLDQLGTVSPGLPLSLEQFTNLADGHRERLIIYFYDYFLKDLAYALSKRLRSSGIEVACLESDMQRALEGVQYLGPDGTDKFSTYRDGTMLETGSSIQDFCVDKPRYRTIVDLEAFCKFVNLRYYDTIMHISDHTTSRFMDMLNYFRVENCMPYSECITRTRSFLERARSFTLSVDETAKLMNLAREQLFKTRTITTVDNSVLRIFVNIEPFIREMRQVSSHDANFIPPSNYQFFNDIEGFKNITSYLVAQLRQGESGESSDRLTFDHYYNALRLQNYVCYTPTLMNLECSLLPSLEQIHESVVSIYMQLLNIAPYIRKIDTTFPCLASSCADNFLLPGPDPVHDPWLEPRRYYLMEYLYETQKGPMALFAIFQLAIKNLFFVDPFDYIYPIDGVEEYEVKVLPPLDEFNDIDALENDIANAEDYYLINCQGWNYEVVRAEPDAKKKKQVTIERDSDDEDDHNVDNEPEQDRSGPRVKINNTRLSLRDLRRFLQLYTAIREFIKQLAPQTTEVIKNKQEQVCKINFGLYSLDITNAVDILIKRANFLRAEVIRIIYRRLVKMSQAIIDDWKLIQDKMNTDCKTPALYAEIKQFLANIHNTIKSMYGKQIILDRYMAVCEEFGTTDKDFVRILHYYYTWFYNRASATSQGGYNKLNEHYRDRLSKTLVANLPEKNDDKFWAECISIYWRAKQQPKLIIAERDGAEVKLLYSFYALTKRKDDERGVLAEYINSYIRQTVEFAYTAALTNPKQAEILNKLQEFQAALKKRIDTFIQEEKYLGLPPTDFSAYDYAVDDFSLFNELWSVVAQFYSFQPIWLSQGDFMNINPKDVISKTTEWTSSLQKLNKHFVKLGRGAAVYSKPRDKDRSACCADASTVCQDVMSNIEQFIVYIPLIEALRNPGLKPSHWAEISYFTKNGRQLSPDQYFTLQVLLDEGLMEDDRLENIIRISDLATRQSLVDYQLLAMLDACKAVELEMRLYATDEIAVAVYPGDAPRPPRQQRYFIVRSFDDAAALLDEQFSVIQGLRASQFGKSREFKTRIDDHDANLNTVYDIIDEWVRFQRLWLYLYPIFTADDIKRQLPAEALLFQEVCVFWTEMTCETNNSRKVWAFASKREIIPKFQANFQKLENVNKQLSSYLQSKRMSFSRFFFLADEELLQILAQTKNIENVQQHIQKCFEGIKRLTFYDFPEGKKITQMVSPEGEYVDLYQPFVPQGDADIWLNEIEKQMKLTIKEYIKSAWRDYYATVQNVEEPQTADPMESLMGPREQWLAKWPAYIVNVLSYVVWTHETQQAINSNNCLLLQAEQNTRIDRLVLWVGCTPETVKQYPNIIFSKAIRTLLTTLLTLWVHNRDVIQQLMKPEIDHDFLFASQLKYYYNNESGEMLIKQVDAVLSYQFEYLGNHSRLAITPLTDRCFLTLTSALAKTFGGNPLGPAGTGKSESVKDLAKSLAIGCYIFNCSEGLNEQSISKFFCGLCICGMYSCLDEFNRCRLDVLSVVASQILAIQRAIRANKRTFLFEGLDIRLNTCCGIFITMNPGYAGRAELPTNLKNLFRPIAMTVPDYVIIAEILLFASGYRYASSLAVKICQTLKLSSEQLSKASHYDFGMRALKSILNAAARLKRLYWREREDILCLRAVSDVNVPKFLAADVALYNNIVSDLFMECYDVYVSKLQVSADHIHECPIDEITIDVDAEHLLYRFVKEYARQMHLTPTPQFLEKVMQLYATMCVRHGLMNVGGTMTGKTTAVRVLARALGQMRAFLKTKPEWCQEKFSLDAYPLFYPVTIHKLNAKSITSDELYGYFSDVSQEWQDGIICTIMRTCNEEYQERKLHFILFDAPVDAIWIENLNTVLDDAKRLCLTSGEVIALPETTTCMFEVYNLEYASPATVSRCGMIYYDATVVDPEFMFYAVCYEMLPAWFMQLDVKLQSSWPVVRIKKNTPVFQSAADLTVCSKQKTDGNINVSCYESTSMTVLERLVFLFKWTFAPIYSYVASGFAPIVFQTRQTVILNLVRVMQAYIRSFAEPQKEISITDSEAMELKSSLPPLSDVAYFVDSVYTFAMIWSIGAQGDHNGRRLFSQAFRHLLYDIPLMLITNGAGASLDFNMPDGKPFSNSSIKMTKAAKDAIDLRASDIGYHYRKLLVDDIVVWRITAAIPFTEDVRSKGDSVKMPHDVCLSVIDDKNAERGKGLLTPFDVARSLSIEWIPWKNSKFAIPEPEFTNIAFYNDIIVPTQDIVSLNALASMLCQQNTPILFAGPSGSGKTTLAKLLMKEDYVSVKCCLTAKTTTGQLRSLVDTKLEKMRKGVYSLSKLKKSIFFVDDAHMPQKEIYEAYPPLEVLRELLEEQGWYDIDYGIFKKIINTTTIMSATTNGELLNILPYRLMHHVTLISVPESADEAFVKIFNKLLSPFVRFYPSYMNAIVENVVLATISLYRKIRKEFKPTPSHMHYLFGPRDLSKVFYGLLLTMKNVNIEENGFRAYYVQQYNFVGLWVNECMRIFADRLINDEDNKVFVYLLQTAWNEAGAVNTPLDRMIPDGVLDPLSTLYEVNYGIALQYSAYPAAQGQEPDQHASNVSFPAIPYYYININNQECRVATMAFYDSAITVFNKNKKLYDASTKMDLILFKYALTHLIRITRMLQIDRGHGLLIGMPSSGKRSLTRLAAASLYDFYVNADDVSNDAGLPLSKSAPLAVIEPNGRGEFMDKIRQAVKIAGIQAHPCLLIVYEALADNFGLECVNFLVNLGEIPNLFNADDRAENEKNLLEELKTLTKPELLQHMAERVVRNLHIIITITPGSYALDNMVTYFPSLLGSMSVDWFTPWKEDTLQSIAQYYLKSEEQCEAISQTLVQIHRDTEEAVTRKYPNLCTSPATFLSLIANYYQLKRLVMTRLYQQLNRYTNGVYCLQDTEKSVVLLRQEQSEKQPVLQKAQQEVSALAKQIDEKRREMAAVREVLSQEEYIASRAKAEADSLAASCQEDLDRAQPLIDRATKALSLLKASDVNEVRSFTAPSKGVRLLGEVLCIVRDVKISTAPDADNWPIAYKVLRANGFLNILKGMTELSDACAQKLGKTYINNPDFTPKVIAQASAAAAGICEWVHALYEYFVVMIDVKPKYARLRDAQAYAKTMSDALYEKQRSLKEAEEQLSVLEHDAQKASEELTKLSNEYEICCNRLKRAEGLISGLSGEQVRWGQEVQKIREAISMITPTALLATAYCACLGGIEFIDRDSLSTKWVELIIHEFLASGTEKQVYELMNFKLPMFVADYPTISKWISNGLSKDSFSLTSASIATMATKVPLLIDPQQTGKKWAGVTLVCKDSTVKIARFTDYNLHKQIETALRCGYSLIIEGIGNDQWLRSDSRMKSAIIAHNLIMDNPKQLSINVRFGETDIIVPNTFRLCLIATFDITIPPDIFGDFAIVTFKATREALTDLLVSVAVECENPEAESSRKALQASIAESYSELLDLETNLLNILSSGNDAGYSLLDNVNLMNALNNTYQRSQEISRKMVKSAQKTAEIEEARQVYNKIAGQAATLFFSVLRLTSLDSMYDNSLQNFIKIYVKTINDSQGEQYDDENTRLQRIFLLFASRIYQNVSRGLFVQHKLTFSLDIALSLSYFNEYLTQQQFELIMAVFSGNVAYYDTGSIPDNYYAKFYVPDENWKRLAIVCKTQLIEDLNMQSVGIYEYLLLDNPQLEVISALSYIVFCACVKQKDMVFAAKRFITERIGPQFVYTESPQLIDIVNESINTVPTLILLSADSDPSNRIVSLADYYRVFCHSISIGKGQGPIAEKAILESVTKGQWVLIGNTHLAGYWLTRLESIIESIADNSFDPENTGKPLVIHRDFRLFLTTMPFDGFPSYIVKAATKVSAEAPIGIKNNFGRLFNQLTEDQLNILPPDYDRRDSDYQQVAQLLNHNYRRLLWNLSLFFSATLERRRFGSVGYSTRYDWSDPDFIISQMQLQTLFQGLLGCKLENIHTEMDNTINALKFLISQINAGGRVSDAKDYLVVDSLMDAYFHTDLCKLGAKVNEQYGFTDVKRTEGLTLLETTVYSGYARFADLDIPDLFGLDNNASILLSQNNGRSLMASMLQIHATNNNTSISPEQRAAQTESEWRYLQQIVDDLPAAFDYQEIEERYPTSYLESMNTVLSQECARYSKLISIIKFSCYQTQKVLKGLILKTYDTECVINALRINSVPVFWEKAAWPSLKPLSTWLVDLKERVQFIKGWTDRGSQKVVWFSGFSYPQAFLTGTLQNYARRQKIPIDQLIIDFDVLQEEPETIPDGAQLISGLFLQGGSLDENKLVDSLPGELFVKVPYILLRPCQKEKFDLANRYKCPVYRTTERKGVLTTTGHSSNYIMDIYLRCDGDENKWIRRGTAMVYQCE